MKPVILIGDSTSHGGTVVAGASSTFVDGRKVACVGDKVTCPKDGHSNVTIVTGDSTSLIDGKAIARHGDKCSCGATLIASVSDTGLE